jgi:hypothetical protein
MLCTAQGKCEGDCKPQCGGKECGPDGCGGICGACSGTKQCSANGLCVGDCTGSCIGKECGDDGCGKSCGTCTGDFKCANGVCTKGCVPDCSGKECGTNGCGGLCGACGLSYLCSPKGVCVKEGTPINDVAAQDDDVWGAEAGQDGGMTIPSEDGLDKDVDPGTGQEYLGEEGQAYTGAGCPAGSKLQYGKCVPIGEDEDDSGDAAGGCAVRASCSPLSLSLLLAIALVLLRRRRTAA